MSDLHWYSLDPLDVLLLREAKPFSPADGSWAKGLFPPMPITVFQALRSALPEQAGQERHLEFLGPFLLQETTDGTVLWLPTPKDLLAVFPRLWLDFWMKWYRVVQNQPVVETEKLDLWYMGLAFHLICGRSSALQTNGEMDEEENDRLGKDPGSGWERADRLQPLDESYSEHDFLGFDPTLFSAFRIAPMVSPGNKSYGRMYSWIKADALARYLKGELNALTETDFHAGDPWSLQVLPHIQIEPGTRQVKSEDGYFTEVAIRLHQGWKLVAGFSEKLASTVVRLGGEGHRVLVTPLAALPAWEELTDYRKPNQSSDTAYLLTPGLAETDSPHVYGVYPTIWKTKLRGCASDRPILAGGMSKFQKAEQPQDIAFTPQRAFVPPGTVYRFKPVSALVNDTNTQLLPTGNENWLKTLQTLGYGTLLWSCPSGEGRNHD